MRTARLLLLPGQRTPDRDPPGHVTRGACWDREPPPPLADRILYTRLWKRGGRLSVFSLVFTPESTTICLLSSLPWEVHFSLFHFWKVGRGDILWSQCLGSPWEVHFSKFFISSGSRRGSPTLSHWGKFLDFWQQISPACSHALHHRQFLRGDWTVRLDILDWK